MTKKPLNARRRNTRGEEQTFERGAVYCAECGDLFKPGYARSMLCPDCRGKRTANVTVYDRDSGSGEVPLNLRQRYGNLQ